MIDPVIRTFQAVPRQSVGAIELHPGARELAPAARRFSSGDKTARLRSRLGRLLHDEAKMREFVSKALPGLRPDNFEVALHAMRLMLRGYQKAEAARTCGISPATVAGWWTAYEAFVLNWLASERDRRERDKGAKGQRGEGTGEGAEVSRCRGGEG